MGTNTSTDKEWLWSFGLRTIRNVRTRIRASSPFGIHILSTIMTDITRCSDHHVQLRRIVHNSPKYSGTTSTTSWQPSTASNSSSLYTPNSSLQLSSWLTMPLSTSSRTDLCCRKQFWRIGWKSQIFCSLLMNHQSMTSTTNTIQTRGTCTSGDMGWNSFCRTSIYVGSGISNLGWG